MPRPLKPLPMMATLVSWVMVARSIPVSYGHVTSWMVSTVTRMRAPARREQLLGALLEALVERETVRALRQLQEFVPRQLGGDPRDDLIASLRGYLQAVESDPA